MVALEAVQSGLGGNYLRLYKGRLNFNLFSIN